MLSRSGPGGSAWVFRVGRLVSSGATGVVQDGASAVPGGGYEVFNGTVRYWNPLNTAAWGADPGHEKPGPLVAALLTFPLDASPLMCGSFIRRDRRRVFPGHRAGIRTAGTLFPQSCDLLTCGFSPG